MADGEESPFEVGTILARDLARNTTEDDLKRHFTRYGDVTEAIIPFNRVTGKPHSFGFVTFSDPSVITVVLSKPHPINNFWAEVSRAMKGEDLQTLEYQRIYVPRPIYSSHIFEGPGDSNKRSIFVSGPRSSRFTKHEVMEYFLGYGNVFSCSFICDESCGLVVFSIERTVDRVLRKSIHNLNGRCLDVWRWYPDYVHSNNISLTYGGVDRINAPTNHRIILGSQASVASFDDQRPKGEARRPNISAPNVTINPQTRHLINFGGYRPNEAGFDRQSVVRRYELAPYNMKDPCANYRANLRYSSVEGGFGNHRIIRRYESAAPNANRNRGINLGYGSNNVVFDNHVVTRPDESAPIMTTPHINRGIDLGSLSNNAVFGDHRVIQPASNTTISHTNRRITPREGVFANNQLEWEQPFTLFRPILSRDARKSSSSNDLPSQEEFEFWYSHNQN
ncbi:uncharacterized protein [Primulina huaijiensis]|uniref:uncharacterized protein n=1 Tax=Primulina huaijiensis TaxID=1492673 RepID=UPI003CC70525